VLTLKRLCMSNFDIFKVFRPFILGSCMFLNCFRFIDNFRKRLGAHALLSLLVIALTVIAGCTDPKKGSGNEYLIRIGDRSFTILEFNETFEIVKTTYPHNALLEADVLKEAKLNFLKDKTEQMILLERAEELGIEVGEEELNKVLKEIKKDYPDGVFEKMLVERAISYRLWVNGLRERLVMEKVIELDLKPKGKVTAKDIADYYETHYSGGDLKKDLEKEAEKANELVMNELKRRKTEDAYTNWIKELRSKYLIEINQAGWEKMLRSGPTGK